MDLREEGLNRVLGLNPAQGTLNWEEEWSLWHVYSVNIQETEKRFERMTDSALGQLNVSVRYCISDMAFHAIYIMQKLTPTNKM